MEKNSPLRGLTWRVGVLSQYESSWMACHRFLHLNAMTGQELYKLMTSRVGNQKNLLDHFRSMRKPDPLIIFLGLWLMTYSLECFHLDIVLNV